MERALGRMTGQRVDIAQRIHRRPESGTGLPRPLEGLLDARARASKFEVAGDGLADQPVEFRAAKFGIPVAARPVRGSLAWRALETIRQGRSGKVRGLQRAAGQQSGRDNPTKSVSPGHDDLGSDS